MRPYMISMLVLLLCAACAPTRTGSQAPSVPGETASQPVFKRITAVIRSSPPSLVHQRTTRSGGSYRGLDGVEELVHAGLTFIKADGTRAPQLAEAVPTVENGLWRVMPDGRMEMTWKIKAGARWQDGTPLTTDDLIFTSVVEQDKALEIPPYPEYELIESISAADASTVVVTWKRPFIDGDGLFSYRGAGLPLPRHILQKAYNEEKTSFNSLPFWAEEFLGTGAFRIREWVRDSHTIMRASDGYIFGRPKIDEIEVKFIPDNNALMANVLAGADLTLAKTISLDMAMQIKDQWADGRVLVLSQNWTPLNPQHINPDPPIVSDLRFRRAMLQALDRQQLADFVFSGHGMIAHSWVGPDTPAYQIVDPFLVKYTYDPRRSAQTLEEIGYAKRSDGFYYDATGKKLAVSIYGPTQNDIHAKTMPPIADMWQRLGVSTEQVPIPPQRLTDRQYRAEYPAFELVERRNSLQVSEMWRLHGSSVPLPENRFTAPGHRYQNAEFDAALERYVTTIPYQERMQALGAAMRHMTENLSHLPIFHGADPTLVSNRLLNLTARGDFFTQAWNVQEWDLKN